MEQKNKNGFRIKKYFKKYRFAIGLYFFLFACLNATGLVFTILMANVVQAVAISEFQKAMTLILIVTGICVCEQFFNYTLSMLYHKYASKIMLDINLDVAKQAFKLNTKTYHDHGTGIFVQRIVNDPSTIVSSLSNLVELIIQLMTSVIMLGYILYLSWQAGLMFVGILIGACIIDMIRRKILKKNMKAQKEAYDKVNSLTTEIVRSEQDIKALGFEEKLSGVSSENYGTYRKLAYKRSQVNCALCNIRNIFYRCLSYAVLIYGVCMMDLGCMTLATFMIIYSNKGYVWDFIGSFGSINDELVQIKVSFERISSLFDEDEFVTEKFGTRKVENVTGKIEFKDVSYTFRDYEYEKLSEKEAKKKKVRKEKKLVAEDKIFDKLSFQIEPNTTVAFVGRSGSGKTTILNLMSKMYVCDSGEVLIDGININDFDKESLRKTISLVNQFPYIFDMTIKENLLLAKPDATEDEIVDSLKRASLWEFVSGLKNGIETKVGESGIKLSGGQKQRLAIARALLRNSSIIIFDESTSSLDNFAQEEVRKSIDALKGHSTIVIVAHRLSTIKNADKIFFLENGKIEDVGTFNELCKKNKKFNAMFMVENAE